MSTYPTSDSGLSAKKIYIALAVVALVILTIVSFNLFVHIDTNKLVVIQSPIDGTLTWHTSSGTYWQGFGKAVKWNKRYQYWFSAKNDQGDEVNQSIKVRFNDGGHGNISGSLSWELPLSDSALTLIYQKYGDEHALEQQLVRTVVEKAVYMTGPVMSSKESYAERRNDLILYIDDQIVNGVYKTTTKEVKDKDPLSGQDRINKVVDIVKDKEGNTIRNDISPLAQYQIRVSNLSINSLDYDKDVDDQIKAQQAASMQVQTARANALVAEQDGITAQKRGEANAATAKWEQEVIKAKAVTAAQQELEVAITQTKQAAQYKAKRILEAEADAEYKRKIIVADGALTQKIDAAVKINQAYAEAIGKYQGNWVPTYVMGGSGGTKGSDVSGVQQMISLLTAKVSRDLALDMSVKGARQAAPAAQEQK